MKQVLILVGSFLIILLTTQCGSIKSNKVGFDCLDKNESSNLILIFCDKDSAYFDVFQKSLHPNNILIYYCLNKKAFQGDTAAIRQMYLLINNNSNSLEFFKKPRGETLFKAVLERVKNFEFIPGPNGEMDFYTYYGQYVRVLSGMIESIDGIFQYDYLNKHIYTKGKSELDAEELLSPKYIQILARLSWETYNEAYEKGLIKLKDFGQE